MKSVVIGAESLREFAFAQAVDSLRIEGMPVTVGRVETVEPGFDPASPRQRSCVLLEVKAFSCNYRDKALVLELSRRCRGASFHFFGSEFVAEVLAIGNGVSGLRQGDLVIADNSYPASGVEGLPPGIPTDFASQRRQVLHAAKLMKVPREMPTEVAAAFSIGAQTIYSVVRRLALRPGAQVLVTAAKSNTSLFAIAALRARDVAVYAASTSRRFEAELKARGVKRLIEIDSQADRLLPDAEMRRLVADTGGFDAVIDPFFDLYLGKVLDLLRFGGRYVTCGLYDQYSNLTGRPLQARGKDLRGIMTTAIVRNIELIGNCLGSASDLADALADYRDGKLEVIVDRVFRGDVMADFFRRTYEAPSRFGKVVYSYED
jgi:NADPH:quinone reductase-like Zn-dependent oxidoreductase